MQLAGVECEICHGGVTVESEATWCAACGTVLHRACLASTLNYCPACRRPYDAPEPHFVYAEVCPECSLPNPAALPSCAQCRAVTRWDNAAAYQEFRAHMRSVSRGYLVRGLAELAGAALCVLIMIASLVGSAIGTPVGWLIGGAMILTIDGIVTLVRSRRIGKFR